MLIVIGINYDYKTALNYSWRQDFNESETVTKCM